MMIKLSKLLLVAFSFGNLYGGDLMIEPKDPELLYNLSRMYHDGNGAQKNEERAFLLCEEAAELGYPKAQRLLGDYYWRKDKEKAVACYTVAAINQDQAAIHKLGYAYDYGKGVRQDRETAFVLYTISAEKGSASAHYNLGLMYLNGEGVEQDQAAGMAEMATAAVDGDMDAQLWMAEACEPIDRTLANQWYKHAAENGSKEAMMRLGRYCEKRQKNKEAFHWYARAVMVGHDDVKPYLARVALKMKATEKDWSGSLRPRRVKMK